MREHLYRAFVPSEGDYYYIEKGNPCWLQFEGDKITLWEEYESWCSGSGEWTSSESIREIKDFVLEQFTGLTDKNGAEIFEGDIVRYFVHNFKVGFHNGSFGLFSIKHLGFTPFFDSINLSCEIIGNIHEGDK
jgi:uncharacterized phage protein (TIGR01671 family)